jgi:hypothetical protein
MGKCSKLKSADLFSTNKTIQKKHKSFVGVIFSIILFLCLIAYGISSAITTLNTPFIWEVKEIKNSQEYTGKFMDFPFEKKLSFGFSPLILDGEVKDESLVNYGWFNG